MNKDNIVIIGGGMAGAGAGYQLDSVGVCATLYEQRDHFGGHTASHAYDDGFIFDEGPHVSFTGNERIQELFANSVNGEFERIQTYVDNYFRGHWVKHPAQVNLYGLPSDLVVDCINDFVEAAHSEERPINNYQDWLLASYGPTFANNFPGQYTRKYHTTEAQNMTTEWVGPRLYRPDLKEVIHGALHETTPDVHYIDKFRYPTHGGFESYILPFEKLVEPHYEKKVCRIDPKTKTLDFTDGSQAAYGHLISSVPLPNLIPMIEGVPDDVVQASRLLACTQVVLVNIGINRPDISKSHWTYIYDDDIVFTRLSFPKNLSPKTVPEGCSAVQVEVYFSEKYKPVEGKPEDYIAPVIRDLIKIGLVKNQEEVIHKSVIWAPWANVIFDLDRPKAIETVHGYLDDIKIAYCGRYGDWGYMWTDQSFISGENAAVKVLDRL